LPSNRPSWSMKAFCWRFCRRLSNVPDSRGSASGGSRVVRFLRGLAAVSGRISARIAYPNQPHRRVLDRAWAAARLSSGLRCMHALSELVAVR